MVVRRPYVFLFRDERDPCERGLINLAQAHTEYSQDQQALVKNTFRLVIQGGGFNVTVMAMRQVGSLEGRSRKSLQQVLRWIFSTLKLSELCVKVVHKLASNSPLNV